MVPFTKIFLKKKKQNNNKMVVNNIKTFLKMKNNCWLSIEKSVIKILFFFFVDGNE